MEKDLIKIFANHLGQKILRPDGKTKLEIYGIHGSLIIHKEGCETTYSGMTGSKILAKPLHKITDQDAISLIEIRSSVFKYIEIIPFKFGIDKESKKQGFTFEYEYESSKRRRTDTQGWNALTKHQSDFLYSKGYALPFMDYSVEHLVKLGIYKLI